MITFFFTKKISTAQVYFFTAIAAFCSIIYELLLAQCLAATLGGTFLRYSITIGLYLFSLGLGSLFVFWYSRFLTLGLLFYVELVLSVLGLLAPFWILFGDFIFSSFFAIEEKTNVSNIVQYCFLFYMHFMTIAIGFLSGIELPLLMEFGNRLENKSIAMNVLAIDFIFTCAGSVFFPLFIYAYFGLIQGAVITSTLNLFLAFCILRSLSFNFMALLICSSLACIQIILLIFSESIRDAISLFIFS